MADEVTAQFPLPAPHEVLLPASTAVDIEGVSAELMHLALVLAYFHFLMFELPLFISSGRDGVHVPTSLHKEGRALDFRTHDKSSEQMIVFYAVLAYLAPRFHCRFFDERVGEGGEHVHVEVHAQ